MKEENPDLNLPLLSWQQQRRIICMLRCSWAGRCKEQPKLLNGAIGWISGGLLNFPCSPHVQPFCVFRLCFSSKRGPFSVCGKSRREAYGFAAIQLKCGAGCCYKSAFLPGWRRQRQACLAAARGEAMDMGWKREAAVRCKGNKATARVVGHWRGCKICACRGT